MSDFGSSVWVWRTDGCSTGPEDEARVTEAIREVRGDRRDRIGPYDHFDLRIIGLRSGEIEGCCVKLTDYFIGDDEGNDGLDPEVILAQERPLAQQFADELERALGSDYRAEICCDFW